MDLYRQRGPGKGPGEKLAAANPEDIMQKHALAQLRRDPPPPQGKAKPGAGIEDADLIASMAKRLQMLESNLRHANASLQRSQSETEQLKSKLLQAQEELAKHVLAGPGAAASAPQPSDSSAVAHLRSENARLRGQVTLAWKQVADMKSFLNDYGMVWVGETPPGSADKPPSGAWYHASSLEAAQGPSSSNPANNDAAAPHLMGPGKGRRLGGGPAAAAPPPATSAPTSVSTAVGVSRPSSRDPKATQDGPTPSPQPQPHRPAPGRPLLSIAASGTAQEGLDTSPSGDAASSSGAGGRAPSDLRRRSYTGAVVQPSHAHPSPPTLPPPAHPPPPAPLPPRTPLLTPLPATSSSGPDSQSAPSSARPAQGNTASSSSSSSNSHAGLRRSASNILAPLGPTPPLQHPSPAASPTALPFRMADLMARVDELNQVAGDGCGQLVPQGPRHGAGAHAHVLHTPDPVRLTVYADGLQLHRGQARGWQDPGARAILSDLLDGYFPAPLKQEFPEGVPIKVVDRSTETLGAVGLAAPGPNRGGAGGAGGNPAERGGIRTFHDLENLQGQALRKDQFLAKLPQAVIRNGKVIDIRGGVGALMAAPDAGSSPDVQVAIVHTPVDALLTTSQRNHVGPSLPPPSREGGYRPPPPNHTPLPAGLPAPGFPGAAASGLTAGSTAGAAQSSGTAGVPEITTLQVKSEDGQQTLIVKLQYDDTVGTLRKFIDAHRAKELKPGGKPLEYQIRTAFPPRAYTDPQETLRTAGLVPNATVFLKAPSSTT